MAKQDTSKLVKIPNLVGETKGQAGIALRELGLAAHVIGGGRRVLGQHPKPGQRVTSGVGVTLLFGVAKPNTGVAEISARDCARFKGNMVKALKSTNCASGVNCKWATYSIDEDGNGTIVQHEECIDSLDPGQ